MDFPDVILKMLLDSAICIVIGAGHNDLINLVDGRSFSRTRSSRYFCHSAGFARHTSVNRQTERPRCGIPVRPDPDAAVIVDRRTLHVDAYRGMCKFQGTMLVLRDHHIDCTRQTLRSGYSVL